MTDRLRIAVAQINPVVGDIDGNVARIRAARAEAKKLGADLMVTGELVVTGYPPEDLVLKPSFIDAVEKAVGKLAGDTEDGGPALIVGAPWREKGKLHNAALLLDGGKIVYRRYKYELPNYGVFDELRVFAPGPAPGPVPFRDVRLGIMVCEDMWLPSVTESLSETGSEILVVVNGSPFDQHKPDIRLGLARERIAESGLPLLYVNLVGGQDELVFDGASFALDRDGALKFHAPSWREGVQVTEWRRESGGGWACHPGAIAPQPEGEAAVYRALCLGLRDYVTKNGFPGIIIGLSGGIDSALTLAVAVDALGRDKALAVMMPSPYTSNESLDDAAEVARLLGVRLENIPIQPAMEAFGRMLAPIFGDRPPDTTEENIQARARGITLMGLSNKFGAMVLSTGNKSEMSVGYATLYGDMCGGYSVLKDVYKTQVYALSHWRNANRPDGALGPAGAVIPARVITKAPTAELKPNQKDQDTLPPYDRLDDILSGLIEGDLSVDAITGRGHDRATVLRVWRMLENAEYKRRQAPPGVKVTSRSFGRDRRYPITNAFKGTV